MANTTSVYTIGIVVDPDTSQVGVSMQQAETAVQDLATTTQAAAADIDTSLATDVPASVDTSAANITTKASKFKAAGTALGTTLADSLQGASSGGEAVANVANGLAGLAAFTATTATGAIGAAGLGLGIAYVKAIADGMAERQKLITDTVNGILGSMELNVKSTMRDIRKEIFDTLSVTASAQALGDGSLEAGLEKIAQLAEDYGVSMRTASDYIRGKVTPATEDLNQKVLDATTQGDLLAGSFFKSSLFASDSAEFAQDIYKHAYDARQEQERSKAGAQTLLGIYQSTAHYSGQVAADATTTAYQLALAAAAAQDVGEGLRNAAAQAGILNGETQ